MQSSGVITKVVIWVLIVLALGLLIYGLAVLGSKDGSTSKTNTTTNGIQDSDHVRGNRTAPVVVIEYGDFQCPACGTSYPLVKQLETELGDKLAVVFRQFPLVSLHKNALQAAYATEAAGKQNKFFEMHDMLYENQDAWSESKDFQTILDSYAKQIGLDVSKFDTDMKSSDVQTKVDDDLASGRKAEVSSTPTFFLNGSKLNIKTYEDFLNQVRAAAANTSVPTTSANTATNNATK
jgi:protein-disulfide isomerase